LILPTKHLSENKSLIRIGADILVLLDEPKTVSRVWNELQHHSNEGKQVGGITYNWFVLGLDLLYLLGAVHYDAGRIFKAKS
jgi:hypothetical protein